MSTSTTSPDTLVTIKINIEGSNRRFKLPLRDLGATTLPSRLRTLLCIDPSSEAVFERYSDSTASFVVLDPENISVYKQLYRAAKAKLKLRLRVTITDVMTKAVQPNQASVEDEVPSQAEQLESLKYFSPPISTVHAQDPASSLDSERTCEYSDRVFLDKEQAELPIRSFMAKEAAVSPQVAVTTPVVSGSPSCCEIPVTRGAAARDKWFAELSASAHSIPRHAEKVVPRIISRESFTSSAAIQFPTSTYSVYCNHCNNAIPDSHYHCSTCDNGDFDLCQACIDDGVLCAGNDHWMIKRFLRNGKVITSTTETIAPKTTAHNDSKITLVPVESEDCYPQVAVASPTPSTKVEAQAYDATRTCNCCVQEFPEDNFVTCIDCEDYDLCFTCHISQEHGHHPSHAFVPAIEGTNLDPLSLQLCAPGRNVSHQAICDGCDQYIYGVRHKCLECPDWDYCSECILSSDEIHPTHRFVPIYEPLAESYGLRSAFGNKSRHAGIYCDGPLCNHTGPVTTYIQGDRYKCAVCDDTDFCAACEASPINTHNKTHPLIKFKTPVRNVSVTTMGNHGTEVMPLMGDRRGRPVSKATETAPQSVNEIARDLKESCQRAINAGLLVRNSATKVQTVADLKPKEEARPCELQAHMSQADNTPPVKAALPFPEGCVAHFVKDTIEDGTIMDTNTVFEQTWTLRNGGSVAWPAGCSVRFVGGDNMCATDPDHPASVEQLVSAAESSTCQAEVAPGSLYNFTVKMRTPSRPGKVISYWRLTGPTGEKFGHRLWCDVSVVDETFAKEEVEEKETESSFSREVSEPSSKLEESQLSFPKLDKESLQASIHQEAAVSVAAPSEVSAEFETDDLVGDEEFDDETEDGFMTDEEWDVLDASDEEFPTTNNGKKSSK